MTESADEKAFASYVVDLMQSIGSVSSKRMFGGYGLFLEGLMFALIAEGTLYLKADKESENAFKSIGLDAFTYSKKGKKSAMSYFRAPEECLDDPEEMSLWAEKAHSAALRAADRKRGRDR